MRTTPISLSILFFSSFSLDFLVSPSTLFIIFFLPLHALRSYPVSFPDLTRVLSFFSSFLLHLQPPPPPRPFSLSLSLFHALAPTSLLVLALTLALAVASRILTSSLLALLLRLLIRTRGSTNNKRSKRLDYTDVASLPCNSAATFLPQHSPRLSSDRSLHEHPHCSTSETSPGLILAALKTEDLPPFFFFFFNRTSKRDCGFRCSLAPSEHNRFPRRNGEPLGMHPKYGPRCNARPSLLPRCG